MSKTGYYVLTAIGTLSSSYFFNFLFFLLRDRYGFSDRDNLWVAALHGAVYIFAAVQGGRFAERRGYHTSLLVGFGGLSVCMAAGALLTSAIALLVLVVVYTAVLLFVWPALEALVVEDEPPARVPDRVGIYNCTWSGTAAAAYFTGGPLYDALGAGAIFGVPAALAALATALTIWLRRRAGDRARQVQSVPVLLVPPHPEPVALRQPVPPETFLRLAWLANPLAYVAIYTLLALMPGLAARFGLTATEAGIYGSLWFFGRLVAFTALWRWTGWHYRFRWLVGGYLILMAGFAGMVAAPALAVFVAAEVAFGLATGLVYSSSLFYAMDLATARAEHGGWHEALIGAGISGGPLVGALASRYYPGVPDAAGIAVTGVMAVGLVGILVVWGRARRIYLSRLFRTPVL